jgi:hypothetical protein
MPTNAEAPGNRVVLLQMTNMATTDGDRNIFAILLSILPYAPPKRMAKTMSRNFVQGSKIDRSVAIGDEARAFVLFLVFACMVSLDVN